VFPLSLSLSLLVPLASPARGAVDFDGKRAKGDFFVLFSKPSTQYTQTGTRGGQPSTAAFPTENQTSPKPDRKRMTITDIEGYVHIE